MSLNSTNDLELGVDTYATFASILAHIPHITLDNSVTKPTRAQACGIARQIFGQLNGALKVLGYQVPVASGNATTFAYVAAMSAIGTAKSLEAAAASVDGRASETADFLQREYALLWSSLRKGEATLPGAARSNPTKHEGERKPAVGFRDTAGTEATSAFSMDTEF